MKRINNLKTIESGIKRLLKGRKKGFTIIELLIASLITLVVIGAVYSCYRAGMYAWRKGTEEIHISQNIRTGLVQIQSEIRSCFTGWGNDNFNFLGGQETMDFTTARSLPSDENVKEYDLRRVIYAVVDSPWGTGKKSLWRWEKPYPYTEENSKSTDDIGGNKSEAQKELPLDEGEELISDLEEIKFQYYDGKEWKDDWNMEKAETSPGETENENRQDMVKEAMSLPAAVKIDVKIIDSDLAERLFSLQVEVPLSVKFKLNSQNTVEAAP